MPCSAALPEQVALWQRTHWRGEPAWSSTCGSCRAIVSEARCRLIYLGPVDEETNLLNAPWPQVLPSAEHPWPNQGGHRFWLGPQHRWVWPPPHEWEFCASHEATVHGGVLSLVHAHADLSYPALTREYAWEAERLRCTVAWRDNGETYFGLHVVAIDAPCEVTARLEPTAEVPDGLVAARMVDPEPPLQLPHPAVALRGGRATVRSGARRVKFGFAPQVLQVARLKGWMLRVHPGPASDPLPEAPDQGFLSQVWIGDASIDIAELEQLTPHLRGDASGLCSTTIFIEAVPPVR